MGKWPQTLNLHRYHANACSAWACIDILMCYGSIVELRIASGGRGLSDLNGSCATFCRLIEM